MTLAQEVAAVGNGSAIKNNVAAPIASLRTSLATLAPVGAILAGIASAVPTATSLANTAETRHASIIAGMAVALPLMKSVLAVDLKLGLAPASSDFTTFFSGISTAEAQVSGADTDTTEVVISLATVASSIPGVTGSTPPAKLAAFIAAVPPTVTDDPAHPGTSIPNPAYESFMSTNSSAMASLNSIANTFSTSMATRSAALATSYANVDTSYQSGLAKLKGMSFIQFCNSTQPPEVAAVISNSVNTSSLPTLP